MADLGEAAAELANLDAYLTTFSEPTVIRQLKALFSLSIMFERRNIGVSRPDYEQQNCHTLRSCSHICVAQQPAVKVEGEEAMALGERYAICSPFVLV